jgi:hypothetical protein
MARPWRDREHLAALTAAWAERSAGRAVFRTDTGFGWVMLHLEGDARPAMMLAALPGAVVAFPHAGPLPAPLRAALTPNRGDPLRNLLREARLGGAGLLADDLILCLDLTTPAGPRELRAQLFGNRGGLALLAPDAGKVLWTAHARPHPALVDPAPARQASPAAADDDALAAWSAAGVDHLLRQQHLALADRLRGILQRRQAAADRLVANLAADLARADGGEARRRDAETLAAGLHTVRRGQDTVTLSDPHDGTPRTITLDPARPPHANLERLFHLARKAERGREVVATRLEAARAEAAAARGAAAALDQALAAAGDQQERLARLQDLATEHADQLAQRPAGGGRRQEPEEPARPFRRYRIDGRWEVWVGRSSEENDTLTHRASHPRDLWLHAQSVAGSHVILRTGGRPDAVPRPVLERAAALAALHSKARHSGLVPVIWTERRYVRRPRKSPPGTAVCLQEQNLFVEPGVAAGVAPG